MDDSIQTLKAEMNKLMSVYDTVKLKPEQTSDLGPAQDVTGEVAAAEKDRSKTDSLLMTEEGREVLEVNTEIVLEETNNSIVNQVVGDESLIRFKDFQGVPTEEATTSISISLPSKTAESDYNVELGVYHENEISGW